MQILQGEQIQELVSTFCKAGLKMWPIKGLENQKILLIRTSGESWDLYVVHKNDVKEWNPSLVIDFPKLPEDGVEAMIKLSGFLNKRLSDYFRNVKANAGRTCEVRRAAARNAARKRWEAKGYYDK